MIDPATGGDRAAAAARPRIWTLMVGVVSVTAGLAFGYDQGVIGGALTFMQQEFGFGSVVEGSSRAG